MSAGLPSGRRRGALTIGARLRGVSRDLGPRNLRDTAEVVSDARSAGGQAASRLTGHQLAGPPARLPEGPLRGRDALHTGRLWRWWHWLGFGYWATLVGVAGWRARQHHSREPQSASAQSVTAQPASQRSS